MGPFLSFYDVIRIHQECDSCLIIDTTFFGLNIKIYGPSPALCDLDIFAWKGQLSSGTREPCSAANCKLVVVHNNEILDVCFLHFVPLPALMQLDDYTKDCCSSKEGVQIEKRFNRLYMPRVCTYSVQLLIIF